MFLLSALVLISVSLQCLLLFDTPVPGPELKAASKSTDNLEGTFVKS